MSTTVNVPQHRTEDARLLQVPEAAGRLGVSRSSLYGLLSSGRLESVNLCGRRLIPTEAIEKLIADLRSEAGADQA